MNKPTASFLVLVVLVSLFSFGSDSQRNSQRTAVRRASGRAVAKLSAQMMKTPSPPISNIGFQSAPQVSAGGFDSDSYFPAVAGDFRGVGKKDAATVVLAGGKYEISVALGNGDGTFQAPIPTLTGATGAGPLWAGDLNGDLKDDLVLGSPGSPATFVVWLSNGDGTFTQNGPKVSLGPGTQITWGTLHKDVSTGFLDLVIADGRNSNIWTALGNGNGTFQTPTSASFAPAIAANAAVAFADFDNDGILDFAATDKVTNQDEVFFGKSGGGYNTPLLLQTPGNIYDSCFDAAGVLTSSGLPDIVAAGANCNLADLLADKLTVYINTSTPGHGSFQTGVNYTVGIRPEAVTIADVNGDGKNDVVTVTTQPGNVRVLLGNGDGTLQPASVGYATGGNVGTQAVVADFKSGSQGDIIVSDREFSFIYLQNYNDGTGNFRSARNYYSPTAGNGFHPNGVGIASGDFNKDGIPDFVIGNFNESLATGITVFISNPDGSMQPGVNYNPIGSSELQYVAVVDFNGDGNLDIAATNSVKGTVLIFYGNGNGTFTQGPTFATDTQSSASALGLIVGDFNGDGKPDLAVVNNYNAGANADVGILINNGVWKQGSGFNPAVTYPLSTVATEITTADLNGDKTLDLIVPLYGTSTKAGTAVAVLLGKGDGTFNAESDVALGMNNPYAAAIGDLNGDGIPDLAVTIQDQTTFAQGIAIALGNGDGTFKTATVIPSTMQPPLDFPNPGYVKMADLDLDGHLDLVYTNSEFGTVSLLYGKGDGSFYDPTEYAAGHRAFDIALADVNGDGQVDVVATGNASDFSGVTVLLNRGGPTTLQSSGTHVLPATPVTFTATVHGAKLYGGTTPTVPTGSVTFYDGATSLGSAALNTGVAALPPTSALATGTHSITAHYGGDANYVATVSAGLEEVVGQAASVTGTPTSSVNPSATGQSVTLSAAVTSTVPGDTQIPTGTITFNDGNTALNIVTLDASGKASFPTSSLAITTHSITAVYSGDMNFTGSKSTALSQVVTPQPDYKLTPDATSKTVNAGSSASFTITLTPSNNYNGTVTIACPTSGLPAGVTCNTPVIAAGQTQATLTINTAARKAAMLTAPDVNPHHGEPNLWASLSGLGMIGMILAGDWKRRNRRGMAIVLLIVALAMILALVGCGGSSTSGGGGGGGGTPAGSYPITVTATGTAGTNGGNTNAHTLNLTLVVN